MGSLNTTFWGLRDEEEYIRQEQQRLKEMRAAAFSAGFEAGAAWATSHGVREMARIFEKTAAGQDEFPPELVKSFAAFMTELAPEIEKIIITETKRARAKAAATRQGGRL